MLLVFQSSLIVGLCYCCFSQVNCGVVLLLFQSVTFNCGVVLMLFQSLRFNCGVVLSLPRLIRRNCVGLFIVVPVSLV